MNLLERISGKVAEQQNMDEEEKQELRYGLGILWFNVSKTVLYFVLTFLLGIFFESLVIMLVFGTMRAFASGVHMKSSVSCTVVGVATYLVFIYLAKLITVDTYLLITAFIILGLTYYKFAPAETEKTPIGPKTKKRNKVISVCLTIIMFFIAIYVGEGDIRNLILFGVLIEAICILPITYKILNKNKQKKGGKRNEKNVIYSK